MAKRPKDYDDDEAPDRGRGRSENRREARGYDAFALKLAALPVDRAKRLPVSDELRASLKNAQDTRSKSARRRHLRHLSGMLRSRPEEAEAIEAFLDGRAFTAISGNEDVRHLEEFREELANPDLFSVALDRAAESLPHLDILLIRELCSTLHDLDDALRREHKAFRQLYRELRRASDAVEEDP